MTGGRRPVLIGAHSPPAPYAGMESFRRLEHEVGPLDITHLFQAWGSSDTADFRRDWIEAGAADGRQVLLTWEPWVPEEGPVQPGFDLRSIVGGRHDSYLTEWGEGLAALDRTVWLRPMHEMNGDWYPWSGAVSRNSSHLYVAAWRHIHGRVRGAGATNVLWVWSPTTPDVPAGNRLENYYPGSEYVDVLGLGGYNWGPEVPHHGGWRSFSDVFADGYERLVRLGPQPVWLTEIGCDAVGGDKTRWVEDMFVALQGMPRIQAAVWFDLDKERDWRMTSPAGVAKVFSSQPRGSSRA